MCSNEFTNYFLNEIDKLGVQNRFIQKIKEIPKKCTKFRAIHIKRQMGNQNTWLGKWTRRKLDKKKVIKSKTCQLLKISYNMNDK